MLKLKEMRVQKGYSQTYIASILEISRQSYSQIENENYMISAVMLSRIAMILECSTDDLIDFDEVKKIYEMNNLKLNKIISGENNKK